MGRFFLPRGNIHGGFATIAGPELEHMHKVLRLRPGDRVTLFDDAGREHEAVIRGMRDGQADLEILRSYEVERESPLNLTLAVGLTKGEKMDTVVEKATELGVQTFVPFLSRYTVPKLDDRKIGQRTERWQKIALSAAKQCGRTRVPVMRRLCDYRDLVSSPAPGALKILFWEKETEQTLKDVQRGETGIQSIVLVIGPEGGFSIEEAQFAREQGYKTVSLGRRVLRAETAALTAISLVQYLWGDLG